MKRTTALKKVAKAAKRHGLAYGTHELRKHSAVRVGNTTRTLGRHNEIDDVTAGKFFDQFADEFGKGWWR